MIDSILFKLHLSSLHICFATEISFAFSFSS
jgi:hypothetical protein